MSSLELTRMAQLGYVLSPWTLLPLPGGHGRVCRDILHAPGDRILARNLVRDLRWARKGKACS